MRCDKERRWPAGAGPGARERGERTGGLGWEPAKDGDGSLRFRRSNGRMWGTSEQNLACVLRTSALEQEEAELWPWDNRIRKPTRHVASRVQ
jgi:hypothetical protein